MKPLPLFVSLTLGLFSVSSLHAENLSLAAIFTDHIVLQRDRAVPVWGKANPSESVSVEFGTQTKTATADPNGRWEIRLDPMPASAEPRTLAVKVSTSPIPVVISDVLVGEVWLCSGQSNMERQLGPRPPQQPLLNWEQEAAAAEYPQIRHFEVAHKASQPPERDVRGKWTVCSPDSAKNFTAVGYFFGRELHKELKVPIGLLHSSWGGTTVATWTSPEALESNPDLKGLTETKLADATATGAKRPSALFENMIRPLIPFSIRGAIWYQGESGAGLPTPYGKVFRTMITDWRNQWGLGDFPFYFVQLPNFGKVPTEPVENGGWPVTREEQASALTLPRTGMAVTIDVGDPKDVHPTNKAPVGIRLAKLALVNTYQKKEECSGPSFASSIKEGSSIRIRFTHTTGGLVSKDGQPLKHFAIADKSKRFVWAEAKIEGDSVLVSNADIHDPEMVRYAWTANPEGANFFNGAGLPAAPFRTDKD